MLLGSVYAITDRNLLPGEALFVGVEQALAAGVKTIQLRDKVASGQTLLTMAARLLALCKQYQAQFIINDQVEVAAEIGAHGVHLGRTDGSIQLARKRLGRQAIIGATCHNSLAWAKTAAQAGADYVAFGRFYSSTTKPDASPATLDLLRVAKRQIALPIVAIGGVNRDNAQDLLRSGADSLAICAGIFAADDIAAATRAILDVAVQST